MKTYSPNEQRLLALLDEDNKITTSELIDKHYNGKAPENARQSINTILRRLQEKARANKEAFHVCSSKRAGPHDVVYWLEH
jgi:hypothetical protein